MTQLSRKQKYQELRDRLDEETTAAQAQPVKLQRLSRVDNNLSHANKPLYPHDTVRVSPTVKEMPTSPVMEDLLGEVKQYNIDNGNRITDDTQINILKQLDTKETRKRNQHVIPMDTDDEDLGSTMKISKQKQPELERAAHVEPKEEKIVLSSQDVQDIKETDDDLDLMYLSHDDFDKTEEQPRSEKKKKSKRKKEKRDELESMPSAKMRMKTSDFEKASKHKEKKSSEIVLNVVLAILIVALVAIIGYLVWTFKSI
ncbi:hypothetical protein [uncultured Holdemanella sp.]|uniref:hypothetical protein n=1 Tax=uncultured Holdemanella sp. TaxID=1763549 RepID=UPI002804A9FC|nr:hypothetical protein [uncultured Holdemanella sp.]